jgi:IS30 family transposase
MPIKRPKRSELGYTVVARQQESEESAMGQENNSTEKKKWKQLSEKERYKIETLLEENQTPKEIAERLGRDRRTIEREIVRGTITQVDSQWRERSVYGADAGQRVCEERGSNKGRGLKIADDHKLVSHIEQKISKEYYSPDAVIGEIKAQGLDFKVSICTKTLYNYIDSGLFLNISNKDLPVKKAGKKRKYKAVRKVALNNKNGRSIEERPVEIETREEAGHWEMDCVVGSGKACLLVMTERTSRKELIFKLKNKTQACVLEVINKLEMKYKDRFSEIFKSVTMDNGGEFLDTAKLEQSCLNPEARRTTCYYAHPYSAWERGSNEVANKLIRRFVPRGTKIEGLTTADIKRIERWMNNYPRRIFNYQTANQIFAA